MMPDRMTRCVSSSLFGLVRIDSTLATESLAIVGEAGLATALGAFGNPKNDLDCFSSLVCPSMNPQHVTVIREKIINDFILFDT